MMTFFCGIFSLLDAGRTGRKLARDSVFFVICLNILCKNLSLFRDALLKNERAHILDNITNVFYRKKHANDILNVPYPSPRHMQTLSISRPQAELE